PGHPAHFPDVLARLLTPRRIAVLPSFRLAVFLAAFAALGVAPALRTGAAQGGPPARAGSADSARSTLDGVSTLAQANAGRDLFAGSCKECHSNSVYAGQPLRDRWNGRTLGELLGYLRREMPKTNPGSMSDQ